jgi:hypothetical protein
VLFDGRCTAAAPALGPTNGIGSNAYAGALPPAGNGNSPGDQFALAGTGKNAVNSVNP